MDMVQEDVGQRVTSLVLSHLGEWLIRGAHWAIELAAMQHEQGVMGKHQLESIISTNFAALTADLPLVIAEMSRLGYTVESMRYQGLFDSLNTHACTSKRMAENVATAFKKLDAAR